MILDLKNNILSIINTVDHNETYFLLAMYFLDVEIYELPNIISPVEVYFNLSYLEHIFKNSHELGSSQCSSYSRRTFMRPRENIGL